MNDDYSAILPFPLLPSQWVLGLRSTAEAVFSIDFLPPCALLAAGDPLARQVATQLSAYFRDPRQRLDDLPIAAEGTAFQRRVWASLRQIPAGQTFTYGQLATGLASGARAVGNACRRNPLPLLVPCHRVVARHGPGGYAGSKAGNLFLIKQALLAHESRH